MGRTSEQPILLPFATNFSTLPKPALRNLVRMGFAPFENAKTFAYTLLFLRIEGKAIPRKRPSERIFKCELIVNCVLCG
jgi:hypothetical protein